MKLAKLISIASTAFLLNACGGSTSSDDGADKLANDCVSLSREGNTVNVTNTCGNDIYVRFFTNETPAFVVLQGSTVQVDVSRVSSVFGACDAPYKPRTGTESGKYFCEK